MRISVALSIFWLAILALGCKAPLPEAETQKLLSDAELFHQALDHLTDVIVHDIFSPPVASRVYAYPCIAAYQTIQQANPEFIDLSTVLNELTPISKPKEDSQVSYDLAAISAFMYVGQVLVFSEATFLEYFDELFDELDSLGVDRHLVTDSKAYGRQVADHILAWADTDNYKESRSFSKYSITDDPSQWKPTPPAYMEGIEPHWREIRTMVIDSAQQFRIAAPPAFDMQEGTEFHKLSMEVYNVANSLDKEKKEIASFWDCNPFVMNQTGHIMYATKKITPGGHWMGISNIASKKAGHDLAHSLQTATFVSIGLYDAFIACWDEKYRSNLVRPETVINEYIDEDWIPLLQTPPFPEHTSGHSVISTAAAELLTQLLGDNFAYTDDVELKYGLPVRHFSSFRAAASEAAISRLYGGIHYMPAITEGVTQGRSIGETIASRLHISN